MLSIGYVMAETKGDVDQLLSGVADDLRADGVRASGVVQINTECVSGGACDMDVRVLPDGPVFRISQSLGQAARGCRLDPDALERAVGLVEADLQAGADCLLINKFGKHEASGRGFRDAIGQAMAAGLPVIVGLNALNKAAFDDFTADMAEALPASREAISGWLRARVRPLAVAG